MMNYEKVYCETEQSWGWSCISCGEYIDEVILENREYVKTIQEDKREKKGKLTRRPQYPAYVPFDFS